jgi:antibiotic biosynthesis monooxygenase (ABM) superfamily enzyme
MSKLILRNSEGKIIKEMPFNKNETNEEWFCSLPTKEKAEWLEEKMTWAAQEQGTFTAKGWEMWLKQPHTTEV